MNFFATLIIAVNVFLVGVANAEVYKVNNYFNKEKTM